VHPLRLDSYVDLDRVRAPVEVLSGTADLIIEDVRHAQCPGHRLPTRR
jgi:hypothetical protein